jgi:NitT/TauT family transport system ATP-binding protein
MIDVSGLTFSFGRERPIFEGFSWRTGAGESWAVIGSSGCGKTTLLYLLAGLLHPRSGTIRIGGGRVDRPRPQTGLILQDHGLLPWATVRENARLGLAVRMFYGPDGLHAPADETIGEDEADRRVDRWLRRLGIDHLGSKFPSQLSGGQRQRTAIARTLALNPDLLLMDEPFSALDAPTREDLQGLTHELRREGGSGGGLTTVTVTHNIEEAAYLGESILVLRHPPNRDPVILANPGAGKKGYRGSGGFQEKVEEIRLAIGEMHEEAV